MFHLGRSHSLCLALIPVLAFLGPAQGLAQSPPGASAPVAGINLPGATGQTCVQVNVAGENPSPYNCLNQALQQQVQGTGRRQPGLPLGATSPSNAVGTFNEQGVSEQYGKNFGRSVIPYRPPPPVFNTMLGPAR